MEAPTPTVEAPRLFNRRAQIDKAVHQLSDRDRAPALIAKLEGDHGLSSKEAEGIISAALDRIDDKELVQAYGVFEDKPFVPAALGALLREEAPVAVGGGELWRYEDGAYRPGAVAVLNRRIERLLGDEWRDARRGETIAFLESGSPPLEDHPPADQINCRNGVYDLASGELRPHDPEERTPVQIGAAYDPEASCPTIERFLAEVLPDPEDRALFYEWAGYLLVPDQSQQRALMLTGGGGNGKSTALNLLKALLGGERNVSSVPLQALGEDKFAAAELYGRLANICGDLDGRLVDSTSTFKQITGGDSLTMQRKFGQPFSFAPYARLVFSANELPGTTDSTHAYHRRWVPIDFRRKLDEAEQDATLPDRLHTADELSGLLNRALAGLAELRQRGHFRTTANTEATAERFRLETDSVSAFVAEECELGADKEIKRSALYPLYRRWAEDAGKHPLQKPKFLAQLRDRNAELSERKVKGVFYIVGISVRPPEGSGLDV